jgi:urease subunit beta
MIPGEYFLEEQDILVNAEREITRVTVRNTGDRPIQIGSHYHFFEVNPALEFERVQALGKHLNRSAGTSVRFEPGEQKDVELVPYWGEREVWGHRGLVNGKLKDESK